MGVEGRARRGCREGEKARKSRERAEKEPRKSERERERETLITTQEDRFSSLLALTAPFN
jgi:hypothetical protein